MDKGGDVGKSLDYLSFDSRKQSLFVAHLKKERNMTSDCSDQALDKL